VFDAGGAGVRALPGSRRRGRGSPGEWPVMAGLLRQVGNAYGLPVSWWNAAGRRLRRGRHLG
jgi:hypothetical protein